MADEEAEEVHCQVIYTDLPDGETEETNWIKRAGNANVTYVNGSTFTGNFDENKLKQGAGVYIWMSEPNEDGERAEVAKYEGNYVDGKRSGVGKFTFPNGDIYEGEFMENHMHGTGTYTYKATQDIYSGAWLNNKKHGYGRYEYFADKSMLVGTWENGYMVSGDWELKDAAVYSGQFKYGVPVGPGKFAFKSGLVLPGTFEEKKGEGAEEKEAAAQEEEGEAAGDEGAVAATKEGVINTEPPIVSWRSERIVSF